MQHMVFVRIVEIILETVDKRFVARLILRNTQKRNVMETANAHLLVTEQLPAILVRDFRSLRLLVTIASMSIHLHLLLFQPLDLCILLLYCFNLT